MVVITIIGVLATSVIHFSRVAIEGAKRARCASNLRVLFVANTAYAAEMGFYAPAAADMYAENKQRWFGYRSSTKQPFDAESGPLSIYLEGRNFRTCPSFHPSGGDGFERGCGGYGYNQVGVGSRLYLDGATSSVYEEGMPPDEISDPSHTAMFCDTAYVQTVGKKGKNPGHDVLIEYSFAEPYHWVFQAGKESSAVSDPTIHFRHRGRANVVWCDGHISAEKMGTKSGERFTRNRLGWFGPADNSLMDPF